MSIKNKLSAKKKSESKSSINSTAESGDIEAIIGGYHGAPRNVLGPHLVQIKGKSLLAIRTFRPLDAEVYIVDIATDKKYSMQRIHQVGFFEVQIPEQDATFAYRLQVIDNAGNSYDIEDPYRFPPLLTDYDIHLHGQGTYYKSYEKLGARVRTIKNDDATQAVDGVNFAVWAPNATRVSIIGSFNGWDNRTHSLHRHADSGLWEIFIPHLPIGTEYKLSIKSQRLAYEVDKTDPFGLYAEMRPATASRVWDISTYEWSDQEWMAQRGQKQALDQPINIYELHLGSWKRVPEDNGFLSYRDLAQQVVEYCTYMEYTHIELMPINEYPFDGSWGYQVIGYFAPTSRYGTPDDFMYFIDKCHEHNIGVILDWVPAHFPKDAHGLAFFDGTHLFEHKDARQGEHREWGTKIFNYDRNEVRNFLISSALFWIEKYHIDGLRVDAVASMLYLDYARESGDWLPNQYGGRENIGAIKFIREFNEQTHAAAPSVLTIAEESTSWPMVTKPTYSGGLGFDLKWNMGWMHDMLDYMSVDPLYRRYHHNQISFSMMYAFSENFVLPFSHDEVVHLKRSMLDKMPGDLWQKFANLRALYAYMFSHPGKKLNFMGGEFGQWREWNEETSLDWHLLDEATHQQLQTFVRDLNHLYRNEPALYEVDNSWEGFNWIDINDADNSVISLQRTAANPDDFLIIVCNFTPVPHIGYRVGVPRLGRYREALNSDWPQYGGSAIETGSEIHAEAYAWQSCSNSVLVNLPPLGVTILKPH